MLCSVLEKLAILDLQQVYGLLGEKLSGLLGSESHGEWSSIQLNSWSPVTFPGAQALRPVLFDVFVCNLDEKTECTLTEFADDSKLGGSIDPLGSRKAEGSE